VKVHLRMVPPGAGGGTPRSRSDGVAERPPDVGVAAAPEPRRHCALTDDSRMH
jgi:hypothetical protein